jgi:hypothetical protein
LPWLWQREAHLAEHAARIAALEEAVRQLKALLQRNASNSFLPRPIHPPLYRRSPGPRPAGDPGGNLAIHRASANCWPWSRRCGRSCVARAWSRPIIMLSECCARRC